MFRAHLVLGLSLVASLCVVACGSSDGSLFDGNGGDGTQDPGKNGENGKFNEGPTGTNAACVASTATALAGNNRLTRRLKFHEQLERL